MIQTIRHLTVAAALAAVCCCGAHVCAQSLGAPYSSNYTLTDLGSVSGVPTLYGGITFLNNNTILLGGSANNSGGAIYEETVVRNITGQITGFSGTATLFATAPFIDGGLSYGPGGDLFATGYPNNTLLEYKPGSTSPDKTITLTGSGIASSVGSLAFIPSGFANAGGMIIASYNASIWYDVSLTPDGLGTYNVNTVTNPVSIGGGPEGIVFVNPTNPDFSVNSTLVCDYASGLVTAYQLDANSNPIVTTAQTFISGLTGAEGAVIDPVTGDFLFSTFGGGNQVYEVSGFTPPPGPSSGTPEPGTEGLLVGLGISVTVCFVRRRRNRVQA